MEGGGSICHKTCNEKHAIRLNLINPSPQEPSALQNTHATFIHSHTLLSISFTSKPHASELHQKMYALHESGHVHLTNTGAVV